MLADNKLHQNWYADKAGARLVETEREKLTYFLSRVYGYHLVFLGEPDLSHLVDSSLIPHHILINPAAKAAKENISCLPGELEALPLASDSVDLVVLAHTLEHAQNPHDILREAYRVLIPEGHIIITSINPYSLWGSWYAYKRLFGKFSKEGKLLGANRMKDWLQLLNFQIIECAMFHFRPPIARENIFEKLSFLEKMGEKGFPLCAGGYALQAIKRVIPFTPVRVRWRREPIWQPVEGIVKPTTNLQTENEELL